MPAGQAPPATPTTSPAQPDVIANIPVAARMRTGPGAEAFVRYFFDVANEEGTNPRGGRLLLLSTPTCKTCAAWNSITLQLVRDQRHFPANPMRVKAANGLDGHAESDPTYRVAARWVEGETALVDIAGRPVETGPSEESTSIVTLVWSADRWHVGEVKYLAGSKS